MTAQVEKLMKLLSCSEEEAQQIILDDKAIEQGQRMTFDLDPEEEKQAKKYANTGTRKVENAPKRKEDPEKTAIIDEITSFLIQKGYKNVEILNKTRQITFKIEKNCYELTLIRKKSIDKAK